MYGSLRKLLVEAFFATPPGKLVSKGVEKTVDVGCDVACFVAVQAWNAAKGIVKGTGKKDDPPPNS
jgi:hypothetical protein